MQSIDDVVKSQAASFFSQVKQVAQSAKKEEEIRIEVERALALIAKDSGITLRGKHEFTIGTGRIDSVYGCVIIEYKNPHDPSARLSPDRNSKGNQEVVQQIKNRFFDFKKQENKKLNSMLGVGCDGNYFIFIRCMNDKWHIEDPIELSAYSVERFIWAIINMGTKGKAFSPEYLAEDFGSESTLAQEGIRAFYETVCKTSSSRTKMFFQQWKILFGEVCGYDIETPSDKIKRLAGFYGVQDVSRPAELMFSLHSYYALLIKLLSAEIVAFFHKLPTPIQRILKASTSAKLKEEMEDLERGSIFRHLNITNFLEGDFFSWYLDSWNEPTERLIRNMANRLDAYNPGTLSENPEGSRDLLKKLYQQLFPKTVRHDLGEYYTPDWLAEHILNELQYSGDPEKKLLDPACGSGTFLVAAVNKVRKWYDQHRETCGYDEGDLLRKILVNIVGFDLNPLAVMTARTNYLISVRDLVGRVEKVELPVYLCDSIMTPSEYGGLETWTTGQKRQTKELRTSVGKFRIPLEIATNRQSIAKYAELLEHCTKSGCTPNEFIQKCRDEGLTIAAEDMHVGLYRQLLKLDEKNKNGIWARIIKNAFAPLFCGKFDYVAGNPPWINWNNLPNDYRTDSEVVWRKYGLWPTYILGASQDFSILFVYACCDSYLENGGRLGFVITQSVFKSKGGNLFRRFVLPRDVPIAPLRVDDLTDFQPFEGATNRTSTLILEKGKTKEYPVPYIFWRKQSISAPVQDDSLVEARRKIRTVPACAVPIGTDDRSPWLTDSIRVIKSLQKVIGKSDYQAVMGIHTYGANAVYFVDVIKKLSNLTSLIKNVTEGAKKKVRDIEFSVESSLLYPLLRGRDIVRFLARPKQKIVLPYLPNGELIKEPIMRLRYQKAYDYFRNFKDFLQERTEYRRRGGKDEWYRIFSTYDAVFSEWKVVWKEQASSITAAVLGPCENRIVIPDHKVMLVGVSNEEEAHYLCSMLNSSLSQVLVKDFTLETQLSTKLLDFVGIEKYVASNKLHKRLSRLGKDAFLAASKEDDRTLIRIEEEIDEASAELWQVTDAELAAIKSAMAKRGRTRSCETETEDED